MNLRSGTLGLTLALLATALRADPPAPELVLRINGRFAQAAPVPLWQGEPVIAEVLLRNRGPADGPAIGLAPPAGSWAARVTVTARDRTGVSTVWAFAVVGRTSAGALALQPRAVTTLLLRLDPAASATIAPGRQDLTARLDLADGTGWRGVADSEPVAIEIVAPPALPEGEALVHQQLLRVRAALLAHDFAAAEAAANVLLAADRMRPEGFLALALLHEARGERLLALDNLDAAVARATGLPQDGPAPGAAAPKPQPIPLEYYDLRQRIEALPDSP